MTDTDTAVGVASATRCLGTSGRMVFAFQLIKWPCIEPTISTLRLTAGRQPAQLVKSNAGKEQLLKSQLTSRRTWPTLFGSVLSDVLFNGDSKQVDGCPRPYLFAAPLFRSNKNGKVHSEFYVHCEGRNCRPDNRGHIKVCTNTRKRQKYVQAVTRPDRLTACKATDLNIFLIRRYWS